MVDFCDLLEPKAKPVDPVRHFLCKDPQPGKTCKKHEFLVTTVDAANFYIMITHYAAVNSALKVSHECVTRQSLTC